MMSRWPEEHVKYCLCLCRNSHTLVLSLELREGGQSLVTRQQLDQLCNSLMQVERSRLAPVGSARCDHGQEGRTTVGRLKAPILDAGIGRFKAESEKLC
jgi:hypothetical protein